MTPHSSPTLSARLVQDPRVGGIRALRDAGLDIHLRPIEGKGPGGRAVMKGRPCLMFGSNDYLGLRWDPRVIEAAQRAVAVGGSGCASSPLMAGRIPAHREIEVQIADWLEREDALLFTTGYQSNVGVLSALLQPGDTAICDAGIHASLLDGVRLSGATISRFRRRRLRTLEQRLKDAEGTPTIVLMDGVYSMEGSVAPIDEVASILGDSSALLMVDEAHSIGVFGPHGGGIATGIEHAKRVDLVSGTLSKVLASCGGFVAGNRDVIEALSVQARSFVFSAPLPAAVAGSALAALKIAREEPERRDRLWDNVAFFSAGMQEMGVDTCGSDSPIVPAYIGDDLAIFAIVADLIAHDLYAGPAVHPSVPRGQSMIRFSITAAHDRRDLSQALEIIRKVFGRHGVLGGERPTRWSPRNVR